jgi:hypothetical protein
VQNLASSGIAQTDSSTPAARLLSGASRKEPPRMTKSRRYRRTRTVERLKKEGRFPSLQQFLDAMVEGRYEYARQMAAWSEFDQIGTTDTKTDTDHVEQKNRR